MEPVRIGVRWLRHPTRVHISVVGGIVGGRVIRRATTATQAASCSAWGTDRSSTRRVTERRLLNCAAAATAATSTPASATGVGSSGLTDLKLRVYDVRVR